MTQPDMNSVKEADCPQCGGYGCVEDVEQGCCGNVTDGGECRGDCSIPIQIQCACDICGGVGKLPILELP